MSNAETSTNALSIRHLGKSFPLKDGTVEALKNIELEVKAGEFLSVIGASGCGKSTMLRLVVGLEKADEGEILLDGLPVQGPRTACGMVFQESRLFPWMSVEANVAFGLNEKLSASERQEKVSHHLELVGLQDFRKAFPYQLSGGMQQRISIARALVNNPSILLLDEPFGALDAMTRITMQQEILRIWEQERTTMVLVTHDIDEAIFLGDQVAIMSARPGTIRKIITVPLSRPRDRSSLEFVAIKKEIYGEFFAESKVQIEYAI